MTSNNTPTTGSPITLAIVGHTNAGKTSLIRTLLRSEQFGCVDNRAGTTRHVEVATIMAEQIPIIELFDTPGLEDSIALAQTLHSLELLPGSSNRDRLGELLRQHDQYSEFDQEIKVIRQALNSDLLLYVIDVREPVLGKYRDEIAVLSMAGRPIIPVFNFSACAEPEQLEHWRSAMASFNLHAVVEFDTVAFDFEAEKRLYQKLQSVMESRYEHIQRLIDYRLKHWHSLQQSACQLVARLLIDVACCRQAVSKSQHTAQAVDTLQQQVRQSERNCLVQLMAIFEFNDADLQHHPLPVTNGQWDADLFDPQTLKEFGLDAGSAAAKGAIVGAGIDLMVAGLSLGSASAIGALIGATWSAAKHYSSSLLATIKGNQWICVDEKTLSLLLLRQLQLLRTLLHRGHAAQNRITLEDQAKDIPAQWADYVVTMRHHPAWSTLLNNNRAEQQKTRQQFADKLTTWLLSLVK